MPIKLFIRGASTQTGVNEEGDEWGKITFEARGLDHGLQRVTCFASDADALLSDLREEGPKSIVLEPADLTYDEFTGSDDEAHYGAKVAPAVLLDALED
jgi:hypothetical protein